MSQRVKANSGPQRPQTRLARHHFDSKRRTPFRLADYFSGLLGSGPVNLRERRLALCFKLRN